LTALNGYVGVSAGAFLAAGLASGITPHQMCRAFIETLPGDGLPAVDPAIFLRPAWAEFGRRLARSPALAAQAVMRLVDSRRTWLGAFEQLGRALPTGVFSNAPIEQQMRRLLDTPGRGDCFDAITRRGTRLVLVATDLDSGDAAPFGLPGWDQVPISRAVAASAALPGLFPPVRIQGPLGPRWYVDGALKKTLHARVLLDQGLDLILCLNPLVPFDATQAEHRIAFGPERIPHLVDGGLPVVMSQTFRALIHSRLELGIKGYETSHPGTDIVLFEPDHRDPAMFLANIFSYAQRRHLAEHAYQRTRADLRARRGRLKAQLARHGIALDDAALDDPRRRLVRQRLPANSAFAATLQRLDEVLDDLGSTLAVA
jgi:predicted acylesterase/phospholipase RssA